MSEIKFPTEVVTLPSKGLIYPKDHPLKSGKVEIKYMTAKEEDILTNQNYIQKGVVLDKLLEALTMKKFNIKDIHPGDKNAIMVAARVLGYGKNYEFSYNDQEYTVDLSSLENKEFNEEILTDEGYGKFTLPQSENEITFKFLTEKDEEKIEEELKGIKKVNKNMGGEVTTRLKHTIVSVEGKDDKNEINSFINNYLLAQDSRALRSFIKDNSPDIDLSFNDNEGNNNPIPITLGFFWPDL